MNLSQLHNHQNSGLFFLSDTLLERCINSCHFKSLQLIIQSSPFFLFFGCDSSLPRGFPRGSDSEDSACNAGDPGSIPGVRKIPRRRKWQPTPLQACRTQAPQPGLNLYPQLWKHNLNHWTSRKTPRQRPYWSFLSDLLLCLLLLKSGKNLKYSSHLRCSKDFYCMALISRPRTWYML